MVSVVWAEAGFGDIRPYWRLPEYPSEVSSMLSSEVRVAIVKKNQTHATDTGSAEVQIALMTERINTLTEHFKVHKKDFAGRRGLLALVSRRRSLLDYVRRQSEDRYSKIITALNIRK